MGISERFARVCISDGRIPSLRLGDRVVVPRIALEGLGGDAVSADQTGHTELTFETLLARTDDADRSAMIGVIGAIHAVSTAALDGRAEPVDAFGDAMRELSDEGFVHFRDWWASCVPAELGAG
ncbi:MAG: hypothetical protein Q8K58_10810 [Acidimicrobiales bacterium]|nr:hypothetical protein [Acidimicrobiales bacterium]